MLYINYQLHAYFKIYVNKCWIEGQSFFHTNASIDSKIAIINIWYVSVTQGVWCDCMKWQSRGINADIINFIFAQSLTFFICSQCQIRKVTMSYHRSEQTLNCNPGACKAHETRQHVTIKILIEYLAVTSVQYVFLRHSDNTCFLLFSLAKPFCSAGRPVTSAIITIFLRHRHKF